MEVCPASVRSPWVWRPRLWPISPTVTESDTTCQGVNPGCTPCVYPPSRPCISRRLVRPECMPCKPVNGPSLPFPLNLGSSYPWSCTPTRPERLYPPWPWVINPHPWSSATLTASLDPAIVPPSVRLPPEPSHDEIRALSAPFRPRNDRSPP